jgi:hypothetical protein
LHAGGFATPAVLASVAGGGILLIGFVLIEAASMQPMMPLDVFQSRDFSGANLVTLLLYFGVGGTLFFLPFTLIRAHGFSATQAGAALLPIPLIIGGLSRFAGGGFASRFGPRVLLTTGSSVTAVGFALFALVPLLTGDTSYWSAFFPALVVTGLGMTLTVTPLTTTVMASVASERIGIASGINNAVARVASLIAVAALGIVFTWTHEASLSARLDTLHIPHRAGPVQRSIAPAAASADGLMRHDASVTHAEQAALDAAFRAVALVCAAGALGGALCAALMVSKRK